jgi:hypothetical protein
MDPGISLAKIHGPDRNKGIMGTRILKLSLLFTVVYMGAVCCTTAGADPGAAAAGRIALTRAVMCESIRGYEPHNKAVVFSIHAGKISCFTSFDQIGVTTAALHKWYRRDELVTTKRLTLKPPSWSTYSSIQLREADKGPWCVEIWDDYNHLLGTLRFSVTD